MRRDQRVVNFHGEYSSLLEIFLNENCPGKQIPVGTSEKDSTCISPFVHPDVHVITCTSFMWLEMHASMEEFTWFL
jgi:hypothetical protein